MPRNFVVISQGLKIEKNVDGFLVKIWSIFPSDFEYKRHGLDDENLSKCAFVALLYPLSVLLDFN